jgi:hypothetical protein
MKLSSTMTMKMLWTWFTEKKMYMYKKMLPNNRAASIIAV